MVIKNINCVYFYSFTLIKPYFYVYNYEHKDIIFHFSFILFTFINQNSMFCFINLKS